MNSNPARRRLFPAWARRSFACAFALVCLGALAYRAAAGGGTLDSTFNVSGTVTTDFGGEDKAYAVAVQPDQKIVVAGASRSNSQTYDYHIILARYNPDGTLDTGFGSGGRVSGTVTPRQASAVALQTDGKIVTAGVGTADVTRFNGDGSLDTTFGSGGSTGRLLNANAMILQPDGKILVGGYLSVAYHTTNFAVVRYNPDGTVDTSFGTAGRATTEFYGGHDEIHALALQSDGKVVAAGQATWGGDAYYSVLARYNPDGTLDPAFGSGGKVTTDFSPTEGNKYHRFYSVTVQPDGKILAAGATRHYDDWDSFAVARYNTDGTLDATFGSGGLVTTKIFGQPSTGSGLALQTDGKFYVAGCTSGGYGCFGSGVFALARYNADGSLDTSFGYNNSGELNTSVTGYGDDEGSAVAIQQDGKVVVAGSSQIPGYSYDFAVARYLTGSPRQQPPPPAPPPVASKADDDPVPPPSDGSIAPPDSPDEPPCTR